MNSFARVWIAAVSVALLSSRVLARDLSGTTYEKVGREFDLDPLLLYSVTLVESAVVSNDGTTVSPYPWTLRLDRPFYEKSRKEAEEELKRVIDRGVGVDVGLMQINTKWHGHRVENVTDLLGPETNLQVGAAILSERLKASPKDALLAIGRYHSFTPSRAQWYAKHVVRVWSRIKDLAGTVIRRAGERINPLQIRPFNQTILIFNADSRPETRRVEKFIAELRKQGKSMPVLIATAINKEHGWASYTELTDRFDAHLNVLTPEMRQRWAITRTPSFIWADNAKKIFYVQEIAVERGLEIKSEETVSQ